MPLGFILFTFEHANDQILLKAFLILKILLKSNTVVTYVVLICIAKTKASQGAPLGKAPVNVSLINSR
jgi:hypothetical protein